MQTWVLQKYEAKKTPEYPGFSYGVVAFSSTAGVYALWQLFS
jgi:hypothetical protein